MIKLGSPLAVFFSSLVVSASGGALASSGVGAQKVSYITSSSKSPAKQAWVRAIRYDSPNELLDIISRNCIPSFIGCSASRGKTALMVAAKANDLPLAQSLVEVGASVDATTDMQQTALMVAVSAGHMRMAQWLVDQGADINKVGSNGQSAMTIAAANGDIAILQWLVTLGAQTQIPDVYKVTPLIRAVAEGQLESACVLLSLVETNVNAQDENGNTALHHAVLSNCTELVSVLLEHRADPTILNHQALTALNLAITTSAASNQIAQALVEQS